MKKLLLITILSVISTLYAITPSLIVGAQEYNINGMYQGKYYIDITLTQNFGNLSLYGNYRNEIDFKQLQPIAFTPRQDYYIVGASYDFGFATIRAEHMCMHPVVSSNQWDGLQGGYTRLEITLGD